MINIDLKNLNNEYDVGFIGEHNAEKLHIDISSLMSSDISFFVCVFCNGYAETYNSERYYVKDISDNSIDTVLSQSLTKTEKCKMVVGAYGVDKDGKVNLLQKSDIVNLHFLDSIDDTNAMYKPEIEGLYKELVDLENKFNNGLDLLESKLESIATATASANTAATAATAVANDIKQKSENGYFNGAKGDKGDPGTPGKDGAPGKDGYTPIKGVDYFDGVKGDKGEKGDRGEKGEQGIQGLPGVNGKNGADGKNATINGKNAVNIVAGDNINLEESGENIKISASCVMKPLALSTNANAPTLLTDTGAGAYITTNTGYIATSGGFKKVVGKGAELIVVLTNKNGVSQLCVTVQTGSSVLFFWDEMTASDTNEIFLSTLSVKKDLDALTDRNVMSGLLSKIMFEECIKKSEIGDGLKFADGKLSLDIPTATSNTTYGGGA